MPLEVRDRETFYDPAPPVIAPGQTYDSVTAKISDIVLVRPHPRSWYLVFGIGLLFVIVLHAVATGLFAIGVGLFGINIPVGWGFDIVNFVWWIGIGHAGTLISAFLLLMRQKWRQSINRFAEAMTLFAVMCAGMFPLLHLGRPWFFYWLLPYPSTFWVQPNFRSPLVWDVFAVSTYFTISLVFWFTGLIPDFATLRDRAKNLWTQRIFGVLSMGWRGSARHWQRYEMAYLLLAGLATPLVISVHTVVSFDFAVGVVPGWHSTIFPPYFVAGAIYSGFAMVLTLVIPIRKMYGLEEVITLRHLRFMGEVMLFTGLIVGYGYLMEAFMAWYSANQYEQYMMINRMFGFYGWVFWLVILCNVLAPQPIWFERIKASPLALFIISLLVNLGMWLERFMIIVVSLSRDFTPSAWGRYAPTIWDWGAFTGTLGFFVAGMFLFIRYVPMISMFELRGLVPEPSKEGSAD